MTVRTFGEADVAWWNVMGLQLSAKHVAGGLSAMQAPMESGTYLLLVKPQDGEQRMFTVIVR